LWNTPRGGDVGPWRERLDRLTIDGEVVVMNIAIVYESLFGNTREIGEAIAEGLKEGDPGAQVTVVPVARTTYEMIGNVDLLIVGSPTHIRRMPTTRTRVSGRESLPEDAITVKGRSAKRAGAIPSGVREWLNGLPLSTELRHAAAFDTRLSSRLAGGASPAIARKLRRSGYSVESEPQGFIVDGGKGPVAAGERERARQWGAELTRLSSAQPA
jgi:hypothetical protein